MLNCHGESGVVRAGEAEFFAEAVRCYGPGVVETGLQLEGLLAREVGCVQVYDPAFTMAGGRQLDEAGAEVQSDDLESQADAQAGFV